MKKTSWIIALISAFCIIATYLFFSITGPPRKAREFALKTNQLQEILNSNKTDDAKIVALSHFIDFAEKQFRLDRLSDNIPQEVYHDIVVSYVKLGVLHEKQKNSDSEKYFDAAMRLKSKFVPWIKGFKVESKEDLRRYVIELEQKTKPAGSP